MEKKEIFTEGVIIDERYELLSLLGEGGMGSVWLAFDKKLKKKVAIKTIIGEKEEREQKKRLLREAIVAGQIEHQNICTVYDIVEKESYSYIVMQYIEGEPLDEILKREKLEPEKAINIAIQIAKGLAAAHKKGIVHRDIKPSNIIVMKDGTVKILDFGLAKPFYTDKIDEETITKEKEVNDPYSLTKSGVIVGTVSYMSPEQATGKKIDHRSDIFSFGIILYELLTGEKPFKGDSQITIIANIIKEEPEPIENYGDFPKDVSKLLKRLLEKNPDKRFQSFDEVIEALNKINTEKTLKTIKNTVSKDKKRRKPILKISLEYILTSFIIFSIIFLLLYHKKNRVIVIENYKTSGQLSKPIGKQVAYLLKKSLTQSRNIEVIDISVFNDLVKKWNNKNKAIKKENIYGFVSGKVEKIGKMANIETYFVNTKKDKKTITTNGEGEESILKYQIDNISKRILNYCDTKENPKLKPTTSILTSNWRAFVKFFTGLSLWRDIDTTNAKNFLKKAIKIDPNFALSYYYLAEIESFSGNNDKAKEYALKAKELSNRVSYIDKLKILALYYSTEYRFKKQIEALKEIVKITPKNKVAYYTLGEAYFHRGKIYQAEKEYLKALSLSPDFTPALNHLGYCYMFEGKHMQAIETLEKYKELSGGANAFDSLGDAYFYMGDYLNAENNKKTAINIDPKISWVYYSLGYILFLEGKFDELEIINKLYLKQSKTLRTKILSNFQNAFINYLMGKLKESEKYYTKIENLYKPVNISQFIPEVDYGMVIFYSEKKDFKKAEKIIKKLEKFIKKHNIDFENYLPIYKFYTASKAEYNYFKGDYKKFTNLYDKLLKQKELVGYWATFFNLSYFSWRYGELLREANFTDKSEQFFKLLDKYNPNFKDRIPYRR